MDEEEYIVSMKEVNWYQTKVAAHDKDDAAYKVFKDHNKVFKEHKNFNNYSHFDCVVKFYDENLDVVAWKCYKV